MRIGLHCKRWWCGGYSPCGEHSLPCASSHLDSPYHSLSAITDAQFWPVCNPSTSRYLLDYSVAEHREEEEDGVNTYGRIWPWLFLAEDKNTLTNNSNIHWAVSLGPMVVSVINRVGR